MPLAKDLEGRIELAGTGRAPRRAIDLDRHDSFRHRHLVLADARKRKPGELDPDRQCGT